MATDNTNSWQSLFQGGLSGGMNGNVGTNIQNLTNAAKGFFGGAGVNDWNAFMQNVGNPQAAWNTVFGPPQGNDLLNAGTTVGQNAGNLVSNSSTDTSNLISSLLSGLQKVGTVNPVALQGLPSAPQLSGDWTPYYNQEMNALAPSLEQAYNAFQQQQSALGAQIPIQQQLYGTYDANGNLVQKGTLQTGLENQENQVQQAGNASEQANVQQGQAAANIVQGNQQEQTQEINNQMQDTKLQLGAFAKANGIEGSDPFLVAEQAASGQPYAQSLSQLNQQTAAQIAGIAANVTGQNTQISNATNAQLVQLGNQILQLAPTEAQNLAAINTQLAQNQANYDNGVITAEQASIQQAQLQNYQNNQLQLAAYNASVNATLGLNSNLIAQQANQIKSQGNAISANNGIFSNITSLLNTLNPDTTTKQIGDSLVQTDKFGNSQVIGTVGTGAPFNLGAKDVTLPTGSSTGGDISNYQNAINQLLQSLGLNNNNGQYSLIGINP